MELSKKEKREKRFNILGNILAAFVYSMLYIPIVVMVVFSFNDQRYNYYWNGFTTEWYSKLWENTALIDSLFYSLWIAILATVISVVIATIGALGLRKFEFKFKKAINGMLYIPIIVAEIVLAVALLVVFMNVGIKLGMSTILIGHCTFCIPYALFTIKGRISGDNYSLEEASLDLGANRIQTFINVTLPNMMPGVLSAAFLAFTLSFDDVIMSNMLAGAKQSTLPVLILSMSRSGVTPDVNALTTIMLLVVIVGMLTNHFVTKAFSRRKVK